jgi:serine/threonine-protein kinase
MAAAGVRRAGVAGTDGSRARPGVYRPGRERKIYLAVGVLAVVVAAVAGWFLAAGDSGTAKPEPRDAATASAAPSVDGVVPPVPAASGAAGQPLPAGTDLPEPPPVVGGGQASAVSPDAGPTSSAGGEPTAQAPGGDDGKPAASPPAGKRLASPGGVVYASCARGKATLNSWEPTSGYGVEEVQPGPALAPLIVFKGETNRYRTTVTCVAGTPTPVVLPL